MMAFTRAAYNVQRGIDALDPQWRELVVMALRQMDPDARASIDGFNRTIRELLEEAATLGPVGDPEPPSEATETPPPDKDVSSRRT